MNKNSSINGVKSQHMSVNVSTSFQFFRQETIKLTFHLLFVWFFKRRFLCGGSVGQVGLKLRHHPASASPVLGFKVIHHFQAITDILKESTGDSMSANYNE